MRPGDTVICIDDAIKADKIEFVSAAYPNWIKEGRKYTIRAILDNDDIVPGLLLEEVRNPLIFIHLINKVQEPAFGMFRFAKFAHDRATNTVEAYQEIGV
jgi:hypothetical protein